MAKTNNDIAGFIIAQVEVEENTEFGHIITINVAPNHRRQGTATKLIHKIENLLKQKGITQCRLEVREDNKHAIKLYQKLGYQTVGYIRKLLRQKTRLVPKKNPIK